MKDYYYIIVIKKEASIDEIKKAYRKLSLKFHPDINDEDDFFAERFKEIQEAYETLSDVHIRTRYDSNFSNLQNTGNSNNGYNFEPLIEYFRTNKSSFNFEEEIIFSWKTINSDKVTIKPFGSVQAIGQKTFKFKDFKNPILNFEIIAENTNIGKQTKQTLKLSNKPYQELYSYFRGIFESEQKSQSSKNSTENKTNNGKPSGFFKTDKGEIKIELNFEGAIPAVNNKVYRNNILVINEKFKLDL